MIKLNDKEFVLVTIYGKEYLLCSPRSIPQDVREAIMQLTLDFAQMIRDGDIDQIEKEALSNLTITDALMFIFLRKITWLSGGWDFSLVPIGLRCYPTAMVSP